VIRRVALASALALPACTAPADEPPVAASWTALRPAVDLDPDPDVVEIDLVAEVAMVELVPGIATEVWAYRDAGAPDGEASVPGPLIEAELGDKLVVHLQNDLPQGTTLHWHGLRLPDEMDGNPMVSGSIASGASTTAEFVLQDEGLHWYHPHVYADEQIQRGLQGTLVVRGAEEPTPDVERVLVLDDVMLDSDGEIVLEPTLDDLMLGRRGNTLLVNGRTPAVADATRGTLERWRIVNTSNGRFFALAMGGVELAVIGWDGGPVAESYRTDELVVAPGERYDVLVAIPDDARGRMRLETMPFERGGGMRDEGPYTLLELEIAADVPPPPSLTETLMLPGPRVIPRLPFDDTSTVRRFELAHELGDETGAIFTINGLRWPLAPPLHVDFGTTEVWEIVNDGEHDHPFHLHGMMFQVLDRDGASEPTLGWKDTVRVGPNGTTRIAVRFDALGMWMFHCTIPEHGERGMMLDLHVMEPQ
jgi:FtsP/CotA-like multicopper oxidase with cupredoxin domain